jgi:hypothetical protein
VIFSACATVDPAVGLQSDIALLRDTELGAGKGQGRWGASGKRHDSGPPVTLAGHYPHLVFEAAIVHDLLLAQSPNVQIAGTIEPVYSEARAHELYVLSR